MLRIIVADKPASNPNEAAARLKRYNGNTQVLLGLAKVGEESLGLPITDLVAIPTGDTSEDTLRLEFLWNLSASVRPVDPLKLYERIRASINNKFRVTIGTVQFVAKLIDTTVAESNRPTADIMKHKFFMSFSNMEPYTNLKPSDSANNMQDNSQQSRDAQVADVLALAKKIQTKLATLGYKEAAAKIAETTVVLVAKKKKKKKKPDESVKVFTTKLRTMLNRFIQDHEVDTASDEVLQLLMDDSSDAPAGDMGDGDMGGMGDGGGGEGGGGDGGGGGAASASLLPQVGGSPPLSTGTDRPRNKGLGTEGFQTAPRGDTGAPKRTRGLPFHRRSYAEDLRTWLDSQDGE